MTKPLNSKYWIFPNGVMYRKYNYSKEEAIVAYSTMVNCSNCIDCDNCINCVNCDNCSYCINCVACDTCENCIECEECEECERCNLCNNCYSSKRCITTDLSSNCKNCLNCYSCQYSEQLVDCYNCEHCEDLSNEYDIINDPPERPTRSPGDTTTSVLVTLPGDFDGDVLPTENHEVTQQILSSKCDPDNFSEWGFDNVFAGTNLPQEELNRKFQSRFSKYLDDDSEKKVKIDTSRKPDYTHYGCMAKDLLPFGGKLRGGFELEEHSSEEPELIKVDGSLYGIIEKPDDES